MMRTAPPIASMRPSIMETAAGLERMLVKIPGRSGLRTLRPAHAQPEPLIYTRWAVYQSGEGSARAAAGGVWVGGW